MAENEKWYDVPDVNEFEQARMNYIEMVEEARRELPAQVENPPKVKDPTKVEYHGMVDQWYEMNPETEDLLYDGTEIQPGMTILIESPHLRMNVREELSDEELFSARRSNRWAFVSRVEINRDVVHVLAEYEDGTKSKIRIPISQSWIVKRQVEHIVGKAPVPGQNSKYGDRVQEEIEKLRREDFGG